MRTMTIETMKDELINHCMNLSYKHQNIAYSAKDVCRMNIHVEVARELRNEVYEILMRKDDYIIKLYNDIFNNKSGN